MVDNIDKKALRRTAVTLALVKLPVCWWTGSQLRGSSLSKVDSFVKQLKASTKEVLWHAQVVHLKGAPAQTSRENC